MLLSMAATSVCVPTEGHSCPLPLWETLQRLEGTSSQGFYPITAFALGPSAHEILCVPFKSEVFNSPSPVEVL